MIVEGVVSGAAILVILMQAVSAMAARRQDQRTSEAIEELTQVMKDEAKSQSETLEICRRVYDMHNHMDDDGVPLWYVPRSWSNTQEKIIEICQQISNSQVLLVQAIDRLEQRLR